MRRFFLFHELVTAILFTSSVFMVGAYSQTSEPKQGSYILRPPVSASLEFDGPPGGGELILVNKASGGSKFVSIDTTSDMPAGDIVERIRAGIVAYPLSAFMESLHIQDQGAYITNWLHEPVLELRGSPGEYVLGGTEVGLGIPRPVGSLSAGFDFETGRHTFRWHEKEGQYTRIAFCDSMGTGEFISRIQSPGNDAPFQTAVAVSPGGAGYRGVYVVGFDGALPSNASYIYANATEQIEYFYWPFTNGIASNWTGWQRETSKSLQYDGFSYPGFEQEARIVSSGLGKDREFVGRCAQRFRSGTQGVEGGIYRFFIAQTPGRVYRPALRCRIVEEAAEFEGNWSFEIMTGTLHPELAQKMDHATQVVNGDAWHDLSTAGSQISRWYLEHTVTPGGDWMMKQTGSIDDAIPQKDIVLGDEKTAIFFCVRLKGVKPRGVLLDGVRLVDVTDGFANAKLREKVL